MSNVSEFNGGGDSDIEEYKIKKNRESSRSQLKEPWVHAPGKSSKTKDYKHQNGEISTGAVSLLDALSFSDRSSSSEVNSSSFVGSKNTTFKPSNAAKITKTGEIKDKKEITNINLDSKDALHYSKVDQVDEVVPLKQKLALETSDSLYNVSTCLKNQQAEMLSLRKHVDGTMVAELEKANILALETMKDVAELRQSIENLRLRQDGYLSPEENNQLDELRIRILSNLKSFHSCRELILDHIEKKNQANKKSEVAKINKESRLGEKQMQILNTGLHEDTEDEIAEEELDQEDPKPSQPIISNARAEEASNFVEDLKPASVKFESSTPISKPSKFSKSVKSPYQSLLKKSRDEDLDEPPVTRSGNSYYREKIQRIQKKLTEQEVKYSEMKSKMQRLEFQSDSDIKMIKHNLRSQMEDIAQIPSMFHFAETQINQSAVQLKQVNQNELQLKNDELALLKNEIARLGSVLESAELRLQFSEVKNDKLSEKLEAVELENKNLRVEIWSQNLQQTRIEQENISLKDELKRNREKLEATSSASPSATKNSRIVILEDKLFELENELTKVSKELQNERRDKHEVSNLLHTRVDELMEELETSRAKSRTLHNQIQLIKSKYFELFSQNPPTSNI